MARNVIIALPLMAVLFGIEAVAGTRSDEGERVAVRYYSGISGITMPFKPENEVDADTITMLQAYLRVTLDRAGRVRRLEKFLNGKLDFTHEYEYYDDGSLRTAVVEAPGREPVVREFPPGQQK